MTPENFNYRTDPLFLRNQFSAHADKFGIPIIPKSQFVNYELQDLRLLRFDQVKKDNGSHSNRMVHFFLYDYLFESLWKDPEPFVEDLSKYLGVMTPDFSMYIEMPVAVQLYNTFRNRWCGAYLKSKGLRVIPTINWVLKKALIFALREFRKARLLRCQHICFMRIIIMPSRKTCSCAGIRKCSSR